MPRSTTKTTTTTLFLLTLVVYDYSRAPPKASAFVWPATPTPRTRQPVMTTATASTTTTETRTTTTSTQLYLAPFRNKKKQEQEKSNEGDGLERALMDILETEQKSQVSGDVATFHNQTLAVNANNETQNEQDEESWSDFVHRCVSTTFTADDKESILVRDPSLRWISSEMGIKQLTDQPVDDAAVATAILLERTLDTLEDVALHIRRIPYNQQWKDTTPPIPVNRKTVVVLGSGWGAHALMKVADCRKVRLVVVSPTNHFVFTPMLASASVGTVE